MLSAKQEESVPIQLSEHDHRALDSYLDAVLNAYRDGTLSLAEARSDLAHAVTAAAIDNEDFKNYIRLSSENRQIDFKKPGGKNA